MKKKSIVISFFLWFLIIPVVHAATDSSSPFKIMLSPLLVVDKFLDRTGISTSVIPENTCRCWQSSENKEYEKACRDRTE